MLDSALWPSYNLPKNLLLLPWILKFIEDMVNDSTPLLIVNRILNAIFFYEPFSVYEKWSNKGF